MKLNYLAIPALLAGLLTTGSAFSDSFLKIKPFYGNFHGTGPEIALPFFQEVDSNGDGYAESVTLRYRIYTAGTTTLVASTTPKTFPTPSIPAGCSTTGSGFFEDDEDFTARRRDGKLNSSATLINPSNRIHSAITFELFCFDGAVEQERYAVAIYSADMSGATPVWTKYFTGVELIGLNGVDTDGDLTNDMLSIVLAKDTSAINADALAIGVNGQTGATAVTSRWYPIGR